MPSQFITRPDGTVEHVRTGGKRIDPASIKKPDNSPRMMPGVLGDLQAAGLSGLVSAGQTLMRTGDVGKALGAYYTGGAEDISRNASPTTRLIVAPARNLAQSVLGNAPADVVSSAMGRPRPVGAPDAKLLGIAPALPKIKYENPTEEVLGGFVQGAMGFYLASRGLKGVGGAAMRVPGVAGATQAVRTGAQGLRQAAATTTAVARGAGGVTGGIGNVANVVGNVGNVALKASSIAAQGAAPGFIVDYAGFDAGSTLTDQVLTWVEKQRGTPIHAPLLDLVRSAPGDTAADARWKSGVEGMFFVGPAASATIEGLGRVAKSIINLANARQATKPTDPNVPPEPPASGQTVDVTAAPVGPGAKVATDPNAGPGVTQPAPKSKPSAPDIAKAYMDMRPRTPLWEQQGVETQGRLDDPRTDVQAATADFVKATTDAEIAVSRASNTVPDEAGPVPTVDRGNAMPSYSQVRETPVAEIDTDPTRLQFKAAGQGKGKRGVSGSLKDAKSYDPLFGKIVSVWRDPETGRLLVVNGHNRLDLARRSGVETILTWEIDAPNADIARAIGAMENIAEGQGTAWDAAKIMRDMGIDGEEMARRNIDVTKGVAQKGVALARLPQEIFEQGATGKLSLEKAVALGSVKLDDVVVRDVAAQAAKKGWPADKILQAMQEAKFAQTAEATGGGVLPGFEDMFKTSNFEQLLDIRTEAFKALREEMVALTSVAREGRRGILEAAGNVVDVAGSQAARGQAAVAVEIFDRVTGYTGPVRDLLNEMAALVGPKRSAKAIVTENLDRLRAAIEAEGGKPRLPLDQPPAPGAQLTSEQAGSLDPAAVRKAGEVLPDQLPDSYRVDPDVAAAVKEAMVNRVRRIAGDDVVVKFQDSMVFKEGSAAHGTQGKVRRIGGGYNLDFKSSIEGDPIKEIIDFHEMSLLPFKGATVVDYTKRKLNVAAHEAFHVLQLRSMTAKQLKVMDTMFAKLKLYFAEKNRRARASGATDKPIEQAPQAFESYADAAAAGVSPGAVMLGVTPDDIKFFNEMKPTDLVEKTVAGAGKAILDGIALIDDMFTYAERLWNAFRGRGWTSIRDIFAQAYAGELQKQNKGLGSVLDIVGMAEGQEKEWARRIRELDKQGVPGLKPMIDFAKDERLLSEQPTQLTSEMPEGPEGPRPVEPSPGPENSDEWVRRFAQQLGLTKEQLLSGEITYDDLLANSFQKTQSPSGQSVYTATKEDLVDGYNAMSKVLPDRAEMSGRPSLTREELRSLNQAWLTRHGQDGPGIMRGLDPLIAGFEEYQLGALNRAMWLADKKQVEASMEAAMWLNSAGVEGLNESERLARLITAAESARATHEAVMRVTRPWGQLGVEMQVPRNYDAPPATGVAQMAGEPAAAGPPAEAVDIEEAITRELQVEGARPIEETITGKIDEELVQAANGGEITPKAQAAADALAQSLISAGAEPAMRERWWRRLDDPAMQNTGPSGLLMLRVNNLISSGVTANTNFFNGMLNLARFPLQQAAGAVAQGEMKRAMYSMMMYQQYWMNLSNAMRVAGHSLKAGRSLMNMDVSTLDWLDRVAQRDAQGELLSGPDAQTGWTINTVNMSQEYAQRPIGQVINKLWQVVGTGASRLALGIDTFNSTLAGYSYEHVRHLPRGMDLAMERGMKESSPEAWKFAQQYADARTQETMKSAVIDGKNLADVVMESPHAQNFMNAVNFTDNVWSELETRTLSNGISIGQSRGLSGNELQDFAQKYVDEGQMQHRLANFALNNRALAFGRIGSIPGEAMQALSNARGIGPIFKFIQPFQRVPSNIIKSAMRNTPAAVFVDTWWRDVTSEDAGTRDRAVGEVALGSAALSLVAMGSALGYLRFNGGGPLDPAAKEKWTTIEKRMPYSIQIWDETARTWSVPTSMRALEPFATLFGAIGDYTDIANSLSIENRNRLGSSLVLTLARMSTSGVLSKSYFQGFNELYEAAFNPSKIITGPAQRDPLARYMSRIVASLVPYSSALRAARREVDPISRTVDPSDIGGLMGFFQETLDEVRNATPGWSNTLPARRDWINGAPILTQGILGAEIIPADMPWLQAAMQYTPFAAFQQGRETLGPVHEEMGMLSGKGTNFSGPRAADFGPEMRLTPSELEDYVVRFASVKDEYGLTFEQTATKLIESPQYQSWPVEGPSNRDVSLRAAAIQAEIQRFKKLAKEDFKFSTAKGQLIAAEEADAEARKAEKTYIQQYGMDNSLQPAQPSASWSPTPR